MQGESLATHDLPGMENRGEFLRSQQPKTAAEAKPTWIGNKAAAFQARSDGQTVTALGATGAQHCAATASARTNEKAMRALAANHGGLVGTFHVGILG